LIALPHIRRLEELARPGVLMARDAFGGEAYIPCVRSGSDQSKALVENVLTCNPAGKAACIDYGLSEEASTWSRS
jgi:hypothetical protein